ncbi:nucleoside triphosphate pyrophosphohydrolase [Rubritalea marina]|uniref:nucleoside triphosphate pyrophosphohydrolase n=1 Tax=Rubritalea marina TaxID=361055 RepID=UPI00035DAFFD|nr:nucleoside triphosphate pyrophosphohydrolase [Rubritalea marina]
MNDQEMVECSEPARQVERLRAIMHRLRAPGGCPWDAEQTHQSLLPHLIEEAYETVDTIQRGDLEHMREELGDLLLQVVFHSEIAEESGQFTFDDVAQEISEKLIRRHPHVYASSDAQDADAVLTQWDEIKRQEKGIEEKSYLAGVGDGLPAILKALKLQKKAAKVGFDWPDLKSTMDKVHEEVAELEELLDQEENTRNLKDIEAELGDVFFSLINVARKLKINPELALDCTNRKFLQRFEKVETGLRARGETLEGASLEQMDAEWNKAK